MVAPATGQKEAVPQWYDVDVVKGTQFTVTGYNVATETPPIPAQTTPTTAANGQEVRNEEKSISAQGFAICFHYCYAELMLTIRQFPVKIA